MQIFYSNGELTRSFSRRAVGAMSLPEILIQCQSASMVAFKISKGPHFRDEMMFKVR